MKKISISVIVNGNQECADIDLKEAEAEEFLALCKKAKESILMGVEEEDQYRIFDPWLKEQNAALYEKVMDAFLSDFNVNLGHRLIDDKEREEMHQLYSISYDEGGCYLDDNNEIFIEP